MQSDGAAPQRPHGLVFLALLHMIGGAGMTLLLVVFWLIRASASMRFTLPLNGLILVAIPLALGLGVGAGMLRGRSWSWHLATLTYLGCCLSAALTLFQALRADSPLLSSALPEAARLALWAGYGLAGVIVCGGLAAYPYLLRAAPRAHLGIAARSLWMALSAHAALACVVLVLGTLGIQRAARERAIASLHRIGAAQASSDEGAQFMLERLARGGPEERLSAAWALGRSGRAEAVPALLRVARQDADSNVRVNALAALGELVEDAEELQTYLVPLLGESDDQVQAAAVRGLASPDHAAAVTEVGALLVDGADPVRVLAVDALGAMGDVEAVPLLLQATTDPQEEVRSRVAFALGKLGDAAALPALVGMLGDERWEVRANAAQALGMLGDESAREPLARTRRDPNAQVRWAAEAALDKLAPVE